MDASTITCPHCQRAFPLTDAIEQPLVARLTARLTAEFAGREKERVAAAVALLESQVKEKARAIEALEKKEAEQRRALDAEREKIRADAARTATEEKAREIERLAADLAAKDRRLSEANANELALRKERGEFEDRKKAFELELARAADAVRAEVAKQKDEEFRLKEAESSKKLAEMSRQIDELKRKAEQGSQQSQGEVLELDLEATLGRAFPHDEIVPVAKGTQGADVVQIVKDDRGHECGRIAWESKRTKLWSDGWIQKLKDDQLAAKAQIAVIVSTTLPKGLDGFDRRDGVWIAAPPHSLSLAVALRETLLETAAAKRAVEGRQDKVTAVYDYLAGPEFKARVTTIVETFKNMSADLEAEKRAMAKLWAKREKQIERVVVNTAGLHGELQGIIGQALPAIEALELDPVAELPAPDDGAAEGPA